MENLSKKDISMRIDKLKSRVNEINSKLISYDEELSNKYNFASKLGIKRDGAMSNDELISGLNTYVAKIEQIQESMNSTDDEAEEEIKILNNMIYLDDVRLGSITELLQENKELCNREYFNRIADKANQLIREEEMREIDNNIYKLSKKSNFIDKITGKDKIKRVLLENYSLKRNEVINKKYVPENKSLLEIINITKNSGYTSEKIDNFISKISKEYNIGDLIENALVPVEKKSNKIPFFYNKEFVAKINEENAIMMDRLEESRKKDRNYSEFKFSNDILKEDIMTLELFNYNNVIDEVI